MSHCTQISDYTQIQISVARNLTNIWVQLPGGERFFTLLQTPSCCRTQCQALGPRSLAQGQVLGPSCHKRRPVLGTSSRCRMQDQAEVSGGLTGHCRSIFADRVMWRGPCWRHGQDARPQRPWELTSHPVQSHWPFRCPSNCASSWQPHCQTHCPIMKAQRCL